MTRTIETEFPRACGSRSLRRMDEMVDDTTSTQEADDAELMLRYATGDARAFDVLYARHKGPLYRYLLRQSRDRAIADDLFQDVWDRVIRNRKRYQVKARFATFLYRIAHNCAVDQYRLRARRHDDRTEPMDESADILAAPEAERPDRRVADAQFRAAFQQALDALPDEQCAVFLLYEESGLSLEEIGEVTGVGMETAKSRLRYAVSKLRKALGSSDNYSSVDMSDVLPSTQRRASEEER